jgi:hypothetical protein
MLEKTLQPGPIKIIKAAHHIQVQDPVDGLPEDPRCSRIERIVLPSPGAEAVAVPEEGFLIHLIQDGHDGALDDFIFQGAHPEGTLATVRLRDIPTADGLCPIRPTMHPGMQILKPGLQVLPIVFPRDSVDTWGGIPLECQVRLPQAVDREVVE